MYFSSPKQTDPFRAYLKLQILGTDELRAKISLKMLCFLSKFWLSSMDIVWRQPR